MSNWEPTHRHKKRGSTYRVLSKHATLQINDDNLDMMPMTIYQAQDMSIWVRPTHEFEDGRFEVLP